MITPVPDFVSEAERIAVNEACDLNDPASDNCKVGSLCPFCQALAKVLSKALTIAYEKGRLSVVGSAGPVTPHRA